MIRLKRAYVAASAEDGYRVLVDRLWPRGLRKESLQLDAWMKDLAPSSELRKWFSHEPERWLEFKRRYAVELKHPRAAELLRELARRAAKGNVTLLFSAKDTEHNNAVALLEKLRRKRGGER